MRAAFFVVLLVASAADAQRIRLSGGSGTLNPERSDTAASYTATGPNGVRVVPEDDLGSLGTCAALAGAFAAAHVEGEDDPSPVFCDGVDWTRVWTERDGTLITSSTLATLTSATLTAASSTYALRITNNGKVDFGSSTNDECQSTGGRVVCKSWTFTDTVVDNIGNLSAQPVSIFSIYGFRIYPYDPLPTCNAGRAGTLATLSTNNNLYYCTGTEWLRMARVADVSATHDFPNVPATSCVDDTITVAGATSGASVQVSALFALPAGVSVGNVYGSGVDTVSLRLCNVSAVDRDPSSGSYRFVVER